MTKKEFQTPSELDQAFAKCLADILEESVKSKGSASILFSGGSTPKGMFAQLAEQDISWDKVHIGLVDDRMVPSDSDHSNSKLISTFLLSKINGAEKPRFSPLVTHPYNADNNLANAMKENSAMGIADIVVLGMGGDGHFASLFPGDEPSEADLSGPGEDALLYTNAPVSPKFRISHSWGYLRQAKNLFLHFTGAQKLQLLEEAEQREKALPIDFLLKDEEISPCLYWAP